jgi:hypothetical protein
VKYALVLITDELNDLLDDEAAPNEHLVVDDVLQLVVHLCGTLDDELPIFQVLEYRPQLCLLVSLLEKCDFLLC